MIITKDVGNHKSTITERGPRVPLLSQAEIAD